MNATLRMTVNAEAVSMAASIRAAAQAAPLFALTGRAFGDLMAELGSLEAAAGHLLDVAESVGRPIGVNFETGADTSRTAFLPPRGWTEERLSGWIAGRHQELEAQFGQVTRVGNRAERRRPRREGR